MGINLELLISLVEERPVLWDKSMEEYKNRRLTFEAWREIFLNIRKDFQTLTDGEKNELGQLVMKKWANVKDNWVKCHKKIMKYKSGPPRKPFRKYIYYEQMKFLAKTIDLSPTQTNMPTVKSNLNASTNINEIDVSKTKKKKEANEGLYATETLQVIDPVEKEDNHGRIMSFFKGIAPTVESFCDDDIVEFQFEVMKTLRDIKNRRRALLSVQSECQLNQPQCNNRRFSSVSASTSASSSAVSLKSSIAQITTFKDEVDDYEDLLRSYPP